MLLTVISAINLKIDVFIIGNQNLSTGCLLCFANVLNFCVAWLLKCL